MGEMGRREQAAVRGRAILSAALRCFSELGYERATIAEIRRRAGVSTGSLYHRFASKEEIGAELYLQGIRSYQEGLLAELERHPDARAGLKAMVRHHLRWVSENRDWARFLLVTRRTELSAEARPRLRELNRGFHERLGAWFAPHVAKGTLRRLAPELTGALIVGPCQELSRRIVAGRMRTDVAAAGRHLGDAVWRALAVSP